MFDNTGKSYVLCGVSKSIAANSGSLTNCITLPNKTGSDVVIRGFIIKYKSGLDDCLIDFSTPSSKNDPLFFGQIELGGIGVVRGTGNFEFLFIPGTTSEIKRGENLDILIQTFNEPIAQRDISIICLVIEKKV
ncbi:MAG: hypothetical protein L6Q54_15365 [Leptospiraceae bacterium]|nr:hypothetical protein [Leptospiraceae bacterium]MCK6382613.1 hypothetical protein [Leptospiraceae bacterium]NUM42784.1 hypothetical protein [Leptospiraceae bacterium]